MNDEVVADGIGKVDYLFKILLLGDSGVGKSCLLYRFTHNEFSFSLPTTVAVDFSTKLLEIGGRVVQTQIWDTAGQEKYRSVAPIYYRGAKGAIIVFDLLREDSFRSIEGWLELLRKYAGDVSIILVGNKLDAGSQRKTSLEDATAFAIKHGLAYMETSALDGTNVEKAFADLAEEIFQQEVYPSEHNRRQRRVDSKETPEDDEVRRARLARFTQAARNRKLNPSSCCSKT